MAALNGIAKEHVISWVNVKCSFITAFVRDVFGGFRIFSAVALAMSKYARRRAKQGKTSAVESAYMLF